MFGDVINKIKKLRQIKPDKDWVFLIKNQILGQEFVSKETRFNKFLLFFKPIFYTGAVFGLALIGVFVVFQYSLPGDFLYPVKKITEEGQIIFVPENEKSNLQIELANKKLLELSQIIKANKVKNLAPAMNEVQTTISAAGKKLTQSKKINQTTLDQIKVLDNNIKEVENSLAVKIEINKESDPVKITVDFLIKDLEKRTLLLEQKEILEQAKKDFEEKNYSEALIKLLKIN